MDRGDLVPDDVVVDMIKTILEENPLAKGFIFDGFPRTSAQAESLDKMLSDLNTSISAMLSLEVEKTNSANVFWNVAKVVEERMMPMNLSSETESRNTTLKPHL